MSYHVTVEVDSPVTLRLCADCGHAITIHNAVLQAYKGRVFVRGKCRPCHNRQMYQHNASRREAVREFSVRRRCAQKRAYFSAVCASVQAALR